MDSCGCSGSRNSRIQVGLWVGIRICVVASRGTGVCSGTLNRLWVGVGVEVNISWSGSKVESGVMVGVQSTPCSTTCAWSGCLRSKIWVWLLVGIRICVEASWGGGISGLINNSLATYLASDLKLRLISANRRLSSGVLIW